MIVARCFQYALIEACGPASQGACAIRSKEYAPAACGTRPCVILRPTTVRQPQSRGWWPQADADTFLITALFFKNY